MDLCDEKKSKGTTHHEDSEGYERRFCKDVASLVNIFKEYGNPFAETIKDRLIQIVSKTMMDDDPLRAVKTALETGRSTVSKICS